MTSFCVEYLLKKIAKNACISIKYNIQLKYIKGGSNNGKNSGGDIKTTNWNR